MIANQEWSRASYRCGELTRDDRTRPRLQSRCQVLLILNEDDVPGCRRLHAGHRTDFGATVAKQAGSDRLGDLLESALHGSHCIAARQVDGRAEGSERIRETIAHTSRRPEWHGPECRST